MSLLEFVWPYDRDGDPTPLSNSQTDHNPGQVRTVGRSPLKDFPSVRQSGLLRDQRAELSLTEL